MLCITIASEEYCNLFTGRKVEYCEVKYYRIELAKCAKFQNHLVYFTEVFVM